MLQFSVLISVYAKENPRYFDLALKSIWQNQTLKPDEIIIVKDGPIPGDLESILKNQSENIPIKIVSLSINMGLGYALSIGVEECSHNIIARMDSDDICAPDRFQKQLEYLKAHPEISLLSSNIAEFDEDPSLVRGVRKVPCKHIEILSFAKRRNPMNHMAVIFRKSAVIDAGNYQPFRGYEDYFLWVRMLHKGYIAANLNENLVFARVGNNMIARRQGIKFFKEELRLQKEFRNLGFIDLWGWSQNILFRAIPRLLPVFVLNLIYKTLRK